MGDSLVPKPAEHAGVPIPPPLLYVGAFALGLLLQHLYPVSVLPSGLRRVVALPCVGGWAVFWGWSVAMFRRAHTSLVPIKPSTALVTGGPYRLTRNPMYVGLTCLYVGLALWFNVMWAGLLLPGVLLIVQGYVIAREERYLERTFGEEYLRYKGRVRRWL